MATGGRRRPARRTSWLVASLVALTVVTVLATLLLPGRQDVVRLPASLAGLDATPSRSGDVAGALVDRLRAEASVAAVGIGRYGGGDRSVVVLKVLPREALTDRTAGELTAQLLAAVDPRRGEAAPRTSTPSDDGLALLSCTTPRPDAATCVTVEPGQALLVLATGWEGDPLGLAATVRDELGVPAPLDPTA